MELKLHPLNTKLALVPYSRNRSVMTPDKTMEVTNYAE
jgi:hypothetical protein